MKTSEWFLLILALILISASSFVSYHKIPLWKVHSLKDFSKESILNLLKKDGESVGYVLKTIGVVKRKKQKESTFDGISKNEDVFLQDTFLTEDNSYAELKLSDGSVILMEPNSLIKIDFIKDASFDVEKNISKISIISGSIQKNEMHKNIVRKPSNYKEIEERAKKISEAKQLLLKPVVKPVATPEPTPMPPPPPLKKEAPRKTVVATAPSKGEKKIGGMAIAPYAISGKQRRINNKLIDKEEKEFYFEAFWQVNPLADSYEINFYKGEELVEKKITSINSLRYNNLDIIGGNYSYEVHSLKNNELLAKSQRENITFNYHPTSLKTPLKNVKEGDIFFTWEKMNFVDYYVFEISKDPKFSKKITKELNNNFLRIPLKKGTYYWRVGIVNSHNKKDSSVIRFEVE